MSKEGEAVSAYMQTVDRIEPDVHPLDRDGALASIAISQKRSADALTSIADLLEVVNLSDGTVITLPQILMGIKEAMTSETVGQLALRMTQGAPEKPA